MRMQQINEPGFYERVIDGAVFFAWYYDGYWRGIFGWEDEAEEHGWDMGKQVGEVLKLNALTSLLLSQTLSEGLRKHGVNHQNYPLPP